MRFRAILPALFPILLGACAATDPGAGPAGMDPYEETNRAVHRFNLELDRAVLNPVADAYGAATPELLRLLIRNGLSTLALPGDFINHVLQGEPMPALRTAGRLGLNLVFGLGVLDPATEFGLPRERTDFGLTLGRWGVDAGPYLVLPLMGPSTPRHLVGRAGDLAASPTAWAGLAGAEGALTVPVNALRVIETRHREDDQIETVLYESADSYATLRSVYLQRREFLVSGGQVEESLPDIFEDEAPQ
jgi:phospholipid-binding lipoprotein MlaA